MMKKIVQLGLLAATLAAGSTAMATPSYGNIGGPGVYFGSGNVDGNWTIETSNNVQVALRAKDRSTLQTLDGSSGVYHSGQGLVGGNKALWNYEFSVNLRADGTGSMDFGDVMVQMLVDIDPSAATNFVSLNVLNNWPDTAWWDGSAPRINRSAPIDGEYGAQQSANPMFGDSGFNFNPGPGLYDLMLNVYRPTDNGPMLLASVDTQVQVPEPSAIALVGIALGGLAFVSRRRKQPQA